MPEILVTYDGQMAARLVGEPIKSFLGSSTWKIRLRVAKAHMDHVDGDVIYFESGLNYRGCLNVLASLQKATSRGYEVATDASFDVFIAGRQNHIEERSRVGMSIKHDDARMDDAYMQFKSVVDSAMVRPLVERQMRDAFYMTTMRKSADFSVPGSGKTAAVLGMYAYLHAIGQVDRVVVICPKNAMSSWTAEWEKTFGEKDPCRSFNLHDPKFSGMDARRKRTAVAYDTGGNNLLLFNYEGVASIVNELSGLVAARTLLAFDEVHRVKAIDGQRASFCLKIAERAQYVVCLTGTPIPNTYRDIYNMLHLIYPDEYDDFFGFEPGELKEPGEVLKQQINERIRPFFCRTNKDDLRVPRPLPDSLVNVSATDEENELLHILKSAYRKKPLALIIRTLQLESCPSMLAEKLNPEDFKWVLDDGDDFADIDDIDFVDYSEKVPQLLSSVGETAKMQKCVDLVTGLSAEDKSVIVWCIFVRNILNITRELRQRGIAAEYIDGSVPQEDRDKVLGRFHSGKTTVLVTNPHTLAESVSLHDVCHDAVYFEYSYNLVHMLQSKDRINRLGLSDDEYTQYHYLRTQFVNDGEPWSLDSNIYDRLMEKEQTMLDAIDGDYLEDGSADDYDIEVVCRGLYRD